MKMIAEKWRAAGFVPAALALFGSVLLAFHLTADGDNNSWVGASVFVLQVVCLSLAVRFPRSASLALAATYLLLSVQGIDVGVMVFVPLVMSLTVSALGHWRWAALCAVIIVFGVFIEPEDGLTVIPPEGILVNGLLFFGPILIGSWVSAVRREGEREARLQEQRERELEQILHDSVAASLSSIVVRLQGLSIQKSGDALLVSELDQIAHAARVAARQVRALLSPLEDGVIPEARRSVPTLLRMLQVTKQRIEDHGFTVAYAVAVDGLSLSASQLDAIQGVLKEAATNVFKHGCSARPVVLSGRSVDGHLQLEVRNHYVPDGTSDGSNSLGLTSILSHVEEGGGVVEVSDDGLEWSVRASFPLSYGSGS